MKKFAAIALAGAMALGIGLPTGQASAATLEKGPEYGHERPPEGQINWKRIYHSEMQDDGYWVERNTYRAYLGGRTAMKDETLIYRDSSKNELIHQTATTYWH